MAEYGTVDFDEFVDEFGSIWLNPENMTEKVFSVIEKTGFPMTVSEARKDIIFPVLGDLARYISLCKSREDERGFLDILEQTGSVQSFITVVNIVYNIAFYECFPAELLEEIGLRHDMDADKEQAFFGCLVRQEAMAEESYLEREQSEYEAFDMRDIQGLREVVKERFEAFSLRWTEAEFLFRNILRAFLSFGNKGIQAEALKDTLIHQCFYSQEQADSILECLGATEIFAIANTRMEMDAILAGDDRAHEYTVPIPCRVYYESSGKTEDRVLPMPQSALLDKVFLAVTMSLRLAENIDFDMHPAGIPRFDDDMDDPRPH